MEIRKVDNILNEMAYERSEGIKVCLDLGYVFVKHFKKTYDSGINSSDFKHH